MPGTFIVSGFPAHLSDVYERNDAKFGSYQQVFFAVYASADDAKKGKADSFHHSFSVIGDDVDLVRDAVGDGSFLTFVVSPEPFIAKSGRAWIRFAARVVS